MATEHRTQAAGQPALSYLGHPCKIEPLQYDAAIDPGAMERRRAEDPRALAQRFAGNLSALDVRVGRTRDAIAHALREAEAMADAAALEAILAALDEFALTTSNLAHETKLDALAVLERGNLIAAAQQRAEVANG